jgi:hypothetical protein
MILHIKDNKTFDITEIVNQINWQGSDGQLSRRLDITLLSNYYIAPGDNLIFREDKELFRGEVFTTFRTTESTLTPYAFDSLIFLDKSKDDYKFTKTTDKRIIETLCSRFSIPVGNIEGNKVIDKLILREKGLAEIINELDKGYNLFFREGKLYREKKGKTKLKWILDGNVLIRATVKESIEDMKNSIKVIEGNKVSIIKNDELIKRYGLLQDVIEAEKGKGIKIAQDMLKDLGKVFKETEIECIGFNDCITGVYIDIEEKITGIKGTFEITSDNHTYQGPSHTMSLTLKEVS